ncbi:hypothetical protein Poly24_19350 [Rosistilla carotiformis]|uniref:Fibronectin type-III domain-containing protein n=1 Tax=Rosistilla carotiformis TaxID=2528017 RepID=A0A518JRT1_9BACT|nr:hypothetical protein [Rosistilla carotiformis]QDV68226.1 hypothetical protein Poly24_19350 [Rosistilla carotiformis]
MRLAAVALAFLFYISFAAAAEDPLRFSETEFTEIQEGYLTLRWNEIADAAEYQVVDDAEVSRYKGLFPEAFVSGLANGDYRFHVRAFDRDGNLLAQSTIPAEVHVQHWSLSFSLMLMGCGFIVFLVIIGLIVVGTWQTRQTGPRREGSEACSMD